MAELYNSDWDRVPIESNCNVCGGRNEEYERNKYINVYKYLTLAELAPISRRIYLCINCRKQMEERDEYYKNNIECDMEYVSGDLRCDTMTITAKRIDWDNEKTATFEILKDVLSNSAFGKLSKGDRVKCESKIIPCCVETWHVIDKINKSN